MGTELELFIEREGTHFTVTIESPFGKKAGVFDGDPWLHSKLYDIQEAVNEQTPLNAEFVEDYGKRLFDMLFYDIKDVFRQCIDQYGHVTVVLHMTDPHLTELPWELCYDAENDTFLGADPQCSLVRRDQKIDDIGYIDYPLKVLVIVSSPVDLDEKGEFAPDPDEIVALMEPLNQLEDEGKVILDFLERASITHIQDALKKGYHIVHFVGHGVYDGKTEKGYLIIEDKNRNAKKLEGKEVAKLIGLNPPHLLLLTACESAPLIPFLATKNVPAVLAMQYTVLKDIAHQFVERVFSLLVTGDTLPKAVSCARTAVLLEEGLKNPGWFTPVLYMGNDNGLMVNRNSAPVMREREVVPRYDMVKDLIGTEHFVGRRKELWLIEKAFFEDKYKMVVVSGIGGIGKTALASKFVKKYKHIFKGVFAKKMIDEGGAEKILVALDQFLLQYNEKRFHAVIEEPDLDFKLEVLVNCLKDYLIVLDNVEVLLEGSRIKDVNVEKVLKAVLAGDHTKVIITTRHGFTFRDEKAGLMQYVDVNELSLQYTRQLLGNEGIKNVEIQKGVYEKVGGNPQFLEFFMGLAKTRPNKQLVKDMTPVREKIDKWLLDELMGGLTDEGREVVKKFSVFRRPVERDAFGVISGAVIDDLVHYSVVKVVKGGDGNNEYMYSMHQAVRDYGYRLLSDTVPAHSDAVVYYETLFKNEKGDIEDIFELHYHLVASEQYEKAGEVVLEIFDPLFMYGYREGLIGLLVQTIKTTKGKTKAGGFFNAGKVFYAQGNYTDAEKCYKKSLDICEKIGDTAGIAVLKHQLAMIHGVRGEYTEAEKLYRESLDIEKNIGDTAGIAKSLHQLGRIHEVRGEYTEAEKLYRESLDIKKNIGDTAGIATSLHQLGRIHQVRGEYTEAVENYIASFEILSKIGSPDIETVVANLQRIRLTMGEERFDTLWKTITKKDVPDSIKSAYKELEDLIQYILYIVETNDQEEIEKTTQTLRELLKDAGPDAAQLLQLLLGILSRKDISSQIHELKEPFKSILHKYVGSIFTLLENYEEAEKYYTEAVTTAKDCNDTPGIAEALYQLGLLHHHQKNYEEAEKYYTESLTFSESLDNKSETAYILHQLGTLYEEIKMYEKALQYYITSFKTFSDSESSDADAVIEDIHSLRFVIGQHQFDTYWKTITKEEVPDFIVSSFSTWLKDFTHYITDLVNQGDQKEINETKKEIKDIIDNTGPDEAQFLYVLLDILSGKDITQKVQTLAEPYRSALQNLS